jgi:hypothetical protein
LIKKGFIEVWADIKFIARAYRRCGFDELKYSVVELKERRRIIKDLFKFGPYSFCLLVPLGELLLPPLMFLFPNSIPNQFLLENQIGKKVADLVER